MNIRVDTQSVDNSFIYSGVESSNKVTANTDLTFEEITDAERYSQSLKEQEDSMPTLSKANTSSYKNSIDSAYVALPSAGATILAIVQESMSELVRSNRDATYAAQLDVAENMDEQAQEMRDKAALVLASGIISGVFEIGSGLFSTISSSLSLKESTKSSSADEATEALDDVATGGKATKATTPDVDADVAKVNQRAEADVTEATEAQTIVKDASDEIDVSETSHSATGADSETDVDSPTTSTKTKTEIDVDADAQVPKASDETADIPDATETKQMTEGLEDSSHSVAPTGDESTHAAPAEKTATDVDGDGISNASDVSPEGSGNHTETSKVSDVDGDGTPNTSDIEDAGTTTQTESSQSTSDVDESSSMSQAQSTQTAEELSDDVAKELSAKMIDKAHSAAVLQARNTQIGGISQAGLGVGKIISSTVDYFATMCDARIKELEADAQRMQATIDQIKSVNDSLQQTVAKAIDTMANISQSNVETQKRILG